MKKLISIILCLLILTSVVLVTAADAEYTLHQYTELGYMTGYSTREKISLSENWTGGSIESFEDGYGDIIVLRSKKTDEAQQQLGYIDIEAYEASKYSLSFDVKPIWDTKEIRFYFRDSEGSEVAHIVFKNGLGAISKTGKYVGNGFSGEDENAKSFTYTIGEWINVELVADTTEKTVEWYIDGVYTVSASTEAAGVISRIIPFYGTIADVSDYGYIDNFRLSAVTETKAQRDTAATISYRKFDDGLEPNKGLMQAGSPFTAYSPENDEAHPTVAYMNKSDAAEGGRIYILNRDEEGDIVTSGGEYQVAADKDYIVSFDMKVVSGEFAMFMFNEDDRYMFLAYADGKLGLRKNAVTGWEPVENLGGGTNGNYIWTSCASGDWHTIDFVVERADRTIDLYIDGVYSASSVLPEGASTNIRYFMSYTAPDVQTTGYFDNFRLSTAGAGSFYAEGKFTDGETKKLTVTFTEAPQNFNPESVIVRDKEGNVIQAEVGELSGHTFVIKTGVESEVYNVELSDRLMSSLTGYSIAGNIVKVNGIGVFVTQNRLKANGGVLGENALADIESGSKITFETAFTNSTDEETPAKRLILLGGYNADGVLIDMDYATIEIAKGASVAAEGEQIPSITKTADMEKVVGFVWEAEYIPVIEYVESVAVNE